MTSLLCATHSVTMPRLLSKISSTLLSRNRKTPASSSPPQDFQIDLSGVTRSPSPVRHHPAGFNPRPLLLSLRSAATGDLPTIPFQNLQPPPRSPWLKVTRSCNSSQFDHLFPGPRWCLLQGCCLASPSSRYPGLASLIHSFEVIGLLESTA